jgi:hypothetical protein
MNKDYQYKGKKTCFNGLSYFIQEFIKVPKNTKHQQYNIHKEFNKFFIEFLISINVEPNKDVEMNSITISEKYYTEFTQWFKLNHIKQ